MASSNASIPACALQKVRLGAQEDVTWYGMIIPGNVKFRWLADDSHVSIFQKTSNHSNETPLIGKGGSCAARTTLTGLFAMSTMEV